MKSRKLNYPGTPHFGVPSTSHLEADEFVDQTIQNDVPTLKEILNRYRMSGDIIAKRQNLNFSEDNIINTSELNPDVEDLNISYTKAINAAANETFAKQNLSVPQQRPPEGDKEGD